VVTLTATSLFSLEGHTALLTGASGFLGRTFARTLLANGARLVAVGRSARLDDLTADWSKEFGAERVRGYRVDMYDLAALSAVLDEIVGTEPAIDVLVNNAHELGPNSGFNTADGTLESATIDHWMRHVTAGLFWPALAVQKVGPSMKERRRGSIVNISTMYAQVSPDPRLYEGTEFVNPPGYSSAKAGMLAFTRYVASFWGSYGIRANAILPGPFSNTEDGGPNSVDPADPFLTRLGTRTCLGRRGRADELAGALLFLASDASSYVTGHALAVDGGWTTI
jgi:NAD(P)-dependent dehydrogenase (short-subunit alcohol dehydrogenase family)